MKWLRKVSKSSDIHEDHVKKEQPIIIKINRASKQLQKIYSLLKEAKELGIDTSLVVLRYKSIKEDIKTAKSAMNMKEYNTAFIIVNDVLKKEEKLLREIVNLKGDPEKVAYKLNAFSDKMYSLRDTINKKTEIMRDSAKKYVDMGDEVRAAQILTVVKKYEKFSSSIEGIATVVSEAALTTQILCDLKSLMHEMGDSFRQLESFTGTMKYVDGLGISENLMKINEQLSKLGTEMYAIEKSIDRLVSSDISPTDNEEIQAEIKEMLLELEDEKVTLDKKKEHLLRLADDVRSL